MDNILNGLAGRKILLIGIGFYDYEQAIADELRRQGATTFLYDELPIYVRRGPVASLLRRCKIDISNFVRTHHERILSEMSSHHIDQVLVIKGEHVTPWFLDALRSAHTGVQLVAYHWDSFVRFPQLVELQSHFDRVYTFDPADAERFPRFQFRPLFFRPEFLQCMNDVSVEMHDLSFVGWLHHDRLNEINDIHLWADKYGLRTFFYLYTGWYTMARLSFQGQGRFVNTRTMSFKDYVRLVYSSRAIVDLPHPEQTGLTMRAMDALGAGKKLVTTSKYIRKYDFYNPLNIFVIDSDKIGIDLQFLASQYEEPDSVVREKYSLKSWIYDVFAIRIIA